jgi:hypothetical protein
VRGRNGAATVRERTRAGAICRSLSVAALFLISVLPAHTASPEEILNGALARLRANTRSFSRYACIETVERQYFEPAPVVTPRSCSQVAAAGNGDADRLESIDRLRLEVTVSEGREIYSWPGATRFDSRDVSEIIREGPIATGSFGTHLLAVFNNPRVEYRFVAEETHAGRRLLEFRFHVPLEASQYRLRVGASWQAIAYDGSFWLDAESLEMQRFAVEAENVPAATSICKLDAELDYQPDASGARGLLLPSQGQLHIAFESARRTNNITSFSNCREYQAESEVVFQGSPQIDRDTLAPAAWAEVALPIGLPVTLALEAPVDTDTAAAGDLVSARVVTAVRRPNSGIVLIAAGATVHGRLTRVEHHLGPKPYFLIAMSFNRLDWQGTSSPFGARSEAGEKLARDLGVNLAGPGGGFRFWDVGTFVFPTTKNRYVMPAGFESKWMTLAPRLR